MKFLAAWVCGVWLLAVTVVPAAAQTAPANVVRTQISGRDYVRLRDWARAYGFTARWLDAGKRMIFTNRTDQFTVAANTAVAQFNGISLWLNHAVAAQKGALWVSELDARTTLQPLITKPRNPVGKIKTITLDPGHGGKDTGNQVGRENEKKYTLLLAQELRAQLQAAGFTVKLTRSGDKFVDLEDRPALARRGNADLFVSLHFNATPVGRGEVHGSEVYCLTPAGAASTNSKGVGAGAGPVLGNRFNSQNIQLAYQIQRALLRNLGSADRGVRRARFQVLRDAAMPAVLIEAGFMSHPVEGRRIFDPAYRRLMARAIVNGIVAYKKSVER